MKRNDGWKKTQTMLITTIILFMSFTSLFSINSVVADSTGDIHYVNQDNELQDRINDSTHHDIIQINNSINLSRYVIINRSITLKGENGKQIQIDGSNFGFNVIANNVTLRNLTIQNCSTAITIENNTDTLENITINNISIQNPTYGIYIQNTTRSNITNATIINCTSAGIYLSNSSNLTVKNIFINETPTAINITNNSKNNTLSNNSFNTNSISINITSSDNNIIYNNTFINSSSYHAFDNSTNIWNSTTHGNYWDDYNGSKITDGILGDTLYKVSGGENQDSKPLGFFAPTANFSYEPSSPTKINTISFTDNSSDPNNENNPNLNYSWNFGDGNTSYEKNPLHNYSMNNQEYIVTLNVTNQYGQWNKTSQTLIINNSAPTASFTWNPNPGIVNESISFTCTSTDTDGSIETWDWDLGDGNTSTEQNPSQTYSIPGTYTINLTVTDNDGNYSNISHDIDVTFPPVANFTFSPNSPKTSDTISFTCTSTDTDGSIDSWDWDFGDGNTSTEENPTHTYSIRGDYDIILNVTDDHGETSQKSKSITVSNTPPTANFSFSPSAPTTFQTITFTSSSSDPDGSIVNSTWDFDDDTFNYSMNTTTHQYTNNGTYTVTLTVTDTDGDTDVFSINITVLNQGPTASFTFEPMYPEIGETVWFNDTSTDKDGYITNWTWTFQDGSNNYSQNTTYLFSELINKNVTLTVADNDGNASSVKKEIILKKTYTEYISSTTISSFDLSSEANTKIVIKTSNTTNLSVTKYSDIPFGITETISGYENLKTYVDVSLEDEGFLDWINLSLYYKGEDLTDDINLSSLTLFYWNETSDSWVKISESIPSSSDVSSYHGFVQSNITHLTLFTIAGTIAEEEETIDPTLPNIVNSSNDTIFTIANPTLNITYDGIVPEITASLNGTTIQVATTDNQTFTLFIHTALSTGNYTLKVQLKNESLSRTDLIYFSINISPPVQKQETPIEIPLWVWYGILIVLVGAIIYFTGILNQLYNYLIKQKQQSTNEGIGASKPKTSKGLLKDTISSVQHSMSSFDAVVFGSNDPWKQAQESVNHTIYNIDLFTEKPDAYVGIQEKLITEEPTCKDIINLLEHDDGSIEDIKEKTDLSKEELSKELSILLKYGLIEEQDTNMFQLTKQARQLVKGTVE